MPLTLSCLYHFPSLLFLTSFREYILSSLRCFHLFYLSYFFLFSTSTIYSVFPLLTLFDLFKHRVFIFLNSLAWCIFLYFPNIVPFLPEFSRPERFIYYWQHLVTKVISVILLIMISDFFHLWSMTLNISKNQWNSVCTVLLATNVYITSSCHQSNVAL